MVSEVQKNQVFSSPTIKQNLALCKPEAIPVAMGMCSTDELTFGPSSSLKQSPRQRDDVMLTYDPAYP